jgi:hypothetical protein
MGEVLDVEPFQVTHHPLVDFSPFTPLIFKPEATFL